MLRKSIGGARHIGIELYMVTRGASPAGKRSSTVPLAQSLELRARTTLGSDVELLGSSWNVAWRQQSLYNEMYRFLVRLGPRVPGMQEFRRLLHRGSTRCCIIRSAEVSEACISSPLATAWVEACPMNVGRHSSMRLVTASAGALFVFEGGLLVQN